MRYYAIVTYNNSPSRSVASKDLQSILDIICVYSTVMKQVISNINVYRSNGNKIGSIKDGKYIEVNANV